MTPILLPVPHIQQQSDADCLTACAVMVCAYYGIKLPYKRIRKLLNTQWYGATFSHLTRLQRFNVDVQVGSTSTLGTPQLEMVYPTLAEGHPIIASIQAGELSHYTEPTDHAVVIVGIDANMVYINDPLFLESAIPVPKPEFDLAWLTNNELYAILKSR